MEKECNVYTGNFNLKNYLYWIYKFMEIINESDKVVSLIILNKNKTFANIHFIIELCFVPRILLCDK